MKPIIHFQTKFYCLDRRIYCISIYEKLFKNISLMTFFLFSILILIVRNLCKNVLNSLVINFNYLEKLVTVSKYLTMKLKKNKRE